LRGMHNRRNEIWEIFVAPWYLSAKRTCLKLAIRNLSVVREAKSYEKGKRAPRTETWRHGRAGALPRRRECCAGDRQCHEEISADDSLGLSQRHVSRSGDPRQRIAFAGKKRDKCDSSFSRCARRNRRLPFLFLPFPAGDFPKAKGSIYLYAAVERSAFGVRRCSPYIAQGVGFEQQSSKSSQLPSICNHNPARSRFSVMDKPSRHLWLCCPISVRR
jgi:hypothetical protein